MQWKRKISFQEKCRNLSAHMESIKTLTHTPYIKYHQNVINVMSIFMFYKYTKLPIAIAIGNCLILLQYSFHSFLCLTSVINFLPRLSHSFFIACVKKTVYLICSPNHKSFLTIFIKAD